MIYSNIYKSWIFLLVCFIRDNIIKALFYELKNSLNIIDKKAKYIWFQFFLGILVDLCHVMFH